MTDEMMDLRAILEKSPDADLADSTFGAVTAADAFPARRLQFMLKATF